MSLGPRRFALVLAPFLSLFACADLPDIPRGTCGNGVLDPGEDCDGPDSRGTCGTAGQINACRFVCSPTARPTGCPATFGCGADETCRRGTGTFTVAPGVGFAGTDFVGAADFGGTGVKSVYAQSGDVLGLGAPRLFTFDRDGELTGQATFPAQVAQPIFLDANQDGVDDVVGIGSEGLSVLTGQGGTSLKPLVFATYRPPAESDVRVGVVRRGRFEAEGLLYATLPVGGGQRATLVLADDTNSAPNPIALLPVRPDDLGSHTANVRDARAGAEWGLPVIVAKGSREVSVIEARNADPAGKWANQDSGPNAPLPKPRTLVTTVHPLVDGAWAFPVDDDEHDDLVVITQGFWEIAFGDGNGVYSSRPPGVPGGVVGRTSVVRVKIGRLDPSEKPATAEEEQRFEVPLDIAGSRKPFLPFAADANVLTVVAPHGVATAVISKAGFLGQQPAGVDFTLTLFPTYLRQQPWTAAKIGDLTADGYPDVVAGSAQSVDVDFLTGTETILFNGSRIETGAPTSAIGLGDFDGDRVLDVAIGGVLGPRRHQLAISYGSPLSPPTTPIVVGETSPIVQLEVANLVSASLIPTFDLIDDLGVVTTGNAPEGGARQDAITILRGSGNRLPLASLALNEVIADATTPGGPPLQGLALAASAARRTDGTVGYDLAGLEVDPTSPTFLGLRAWSLDRLDGDPTRPPKMQGSRSPVAGIAVSQPRATSVAVDLDNDKADESVFLVATPSGGAAFVVRNPTGDVLTAVTSSPTPLVIPGATGSTVPLAAQSGDVDGDGLADLVITLTTAYGATAELVDYVLPGNLVITVVWNRGGTLDFAQPTLLSPDGTARPTAATFLDLGDRRHLVVASTLGLHVVGGTSAAPTYAPLPVAGTGRPGAIRSLASGDVTGDGVDDLIVGVGDGRVNVLMGTAR